MMLIRSFILLILLPTFLQGQTLQEDLKQVRDRAEKGNIQVYEVTYCSFETAASQQPLEREEALYIRQGRGHFYLNHPSGTYLQFENKMLFLDEEMRQMILFAAPKAALSAFDVSLDSILKFCRETSLLRDSGEERTYRMTLGGGSEYSRIEVTMNVKQGWLKKLVLYYSYEMEMPAADGSYKNTKPRLEVEYAPKPATAEYVSMLKPERYFREQDNHTFSPSKNYSDYEIINHISGN